MVELGKYQTHTKNKKLCTNKAEYAAITEQNKKQQQNKTNKKPHILSTFFINGYIGFRNNFIKNKLKIKHKKNQKKTPPIVQCVGLTIDQPINMQALTPLGHRNA